MEKNIEDLKLNYNGLGSWKQKINIKLKGLVISSKVINDLFIQ